MKGLPKVNAAFGRCQKFGTISPRFFPDVVLGSNPSSNGNFVISSVPPMATGVSGFLGLVQDLVIRNHRQIQKLNDSLLVVGSHF